MNSDWRTPYDVKKTYTNASILKDSRIVFNIKGTSYYQTTHRRHEEIFDAKIDILGLMIGEYEKKHYQQLPGLIFSD